MKIILVDDNADIRDIIKQIINEESQSPCTFIELDDGEPVVETYAYFRPDWIFMDIKMQRVDGLKAAGELLAHFPHARIVFVSQYDDAAYREAARKLGAFGYIIKDDLFAIPELINHVLT